MKQTLVREYKNAHEYNKDLKKLSKQGWTVVQSTDQMKGRSATAKTAIVGSAIVTGGLLAPVGIFALTHRKDHLVITYEREVPDGLSWLEKLQKFTDQHPPGLTNAADTLRIQNQRQAAKAREREVPDISINPETEEVLPAGLSWMQQAQWFVNHRPPGLTHAEYTHWMKNQRQAAKAREREVPDVFVNLETKEVPDVVVNPEIEEVPDVSGNSETEEVLPAGLSWMQQQQWFRSHRPPGLTSLEFGQWIQNQKRAAKARK